MRLPCSLIIITRNRAKLLALCLENLTQQTKFPTEVIIIDNNSSDNTKSIATLFQNRLPIKYFLEKQIGRAAARNRGLKEATQEIILFTDDDCLPPPSWIEQHYKIHLIHETLAVGGPLKIYDLDKKTNYSNTIQFFFDDYINKGIFLALAKQTKSFNLFRFFFDKKNHYKQTITHHLFTANISYKRIFFLTYGNFDTQLITGEENALHNQAFKQGAPPFYFDPTIIVFHTTWPSLKETIHRYFEYGYYDMLASDLKLLTLIKKSIFTILNCGKLMLSRSKLLPKEMINLALFSLAIYSGNNYAYLSQKLKKLD